jgi:hypothetical protein
VDALRDSAELLSGGVVLSGQWCVLHGVGFDFQGESGRFDGCLARCRVEIDHAFLDPYRVRLSWCWGRSRNAPAIALLGSGNTISTRTRCGGRHTID